MPASAIVVEGGAMRGVFAAGVLDVFHEQAFHPFDLAIGVSAGSCTLVSHLGGQHGRNLRCYLDQLCRREFIDARRLAAPGRHAIDLDWLWRTLMRDDPLDFDAIEKNRAHLVFATTCATTLEPYFLDVARHNLLDALKASCALPLLYRGGVVLAGRRLIDGGISAPLPADEAYRRGARRIMVLRTRPARPAAPPRPPRAPRPLPRPFALAVAGLDAYRRDLSFLDAPPPDCEVILVSPPRPLCSGTMTQSRPALLADYHLGRAQARDAIDRWTAA